jgi:predicted class III extradiol MEMO1 family dioxygenase
LHYADSGDVSGDKTAVVGYLAAALGTFDEKDRGAR